MRFYGSLSGFGLVTALLTFAADQAVKWVLLAGFDIASRGLVTVAPFFDIVLVWNTGISYGLFAQNGDAGRWLLVALSLVAIAALCVWMAATSSRLTAVSLGLIAGGAAGNLLDRLVHGAVADFFRFHAFGYSWYVFNLADAAIVAGVALLLYESLLGGHKSAQNGR